MAKLIILSIVLVSFAVPVRLARAPRPRRALRRAQGIVLAFVVVWAVMCLRWYPHLVTLE
jgi:hypothetical protein